MPQNKLWNGDIENIALQDSSDRSLQEQSLLQNTSTGCFCPLVLDKWDTVIFPNPLPAQKKKEKEKKKRTVKKKKYKCIPLCSLI